jgi:hypothetical protein
MDDSGAVTVIAGFMTERLGAARAVLAVVLAGAIALRVRRKSPRAISTSSWSRLPER